MNCKKCGNKLDTTLKFCTNCGEEVPGGVKKNNKNLFFRIIVGISYVLILLSILDGDKAYIFESIILGISTILAVVTQKEKTKFFFVIGVISLSLIAFILLGSVIIGLFGQLFMLLFGATKDFDLIFSLLVGPASIFDIEGGIEFLVFSSVSGIVFIGIDKFKKFSIK